MGARLAEHRALFGADADVSELGRMRKGRRAAGCGRARCGVCHPGKRWGGQAARARDNRAAFRLEMAASDVSPPVI